MCHIVRRRDRKGERQEGRKKRSILSKDIRAHCDILQESKAGVVYIE